MINEPTFAGTAMQKIDALNCLEWQHTSGAITVFVFNHAYGLNFRFAVNRGEDIEIVSSPSRFENPQQAADAARDWMIAMAKALLDAAGEKT